MLGLRGLLAKWAFVLSLLACASLLIAYYVVDFNQKAEFSAELTNIRSEYSYSVDNVLQQRLEQLTLVAEEIYILSDLQSKGLNDIQPVLQQLWPKLEMTFSLSTLALKQDEQIIKFGSLSDDIISAYYNKTVTTLRPQTQFICRPKCSLVSIIPIFLDGKQGTLLVASDIAPTVKAIQALLDSDIAVLVDASATSDNTQKVYHQGKPYVADVVTNAQQNLPLLSFAKQTRSKSEAKLAGTLVKSNGINYYMWIKSLESQSDIMPLLIIKNVDELLKQKAVQKTNLLLIIAAIQAGIIVVISVVSYRPISRLGRLRRTVSFIGNKQYQDAIATLGDFHKGETTDEIEALERQFSHSIYQLMEYEKQLQMSQQRLTKLATVDVTTKLLNRNAFLDDMYAIESNLGKNETTLMFLDLDGFKVVNDNLGHVVGDLLLEKVGARLNKLSTNNIFVYRIGGDEFIVCIRRLQEVENLCDTCNILLSLFDDIFAIDKHCITVSASIGIATANNSTESYIELLKQADIAMYQAKYQGKNRFCFFDRAMMEQINLKYTIKNEFLNALKTNQLSLVYQPIIDANSGKLIKLEALSRWRHPVLGNVRPDIFIEVIEETTFIDDLSDWLINSVADKLKELDELGLQNVVISLNISGAQVTNPKSIDQLRTICADKDVQCERVELEITETSLISDFKKAQSWIENVCSHGFRIAIDDFGTGYSSLSYLTAFPFDCVKIDRSLLLDVETSERTRNIVESVTTMIHSLGVPVVAEGIETASHLEVIKEIGCDYIQGYYFSKPLPEKELLELLKAYKQEGTWIAQT